MAEAYELAVVPCDAIFPSMGLRPVVVDQALRESIERHGILSPLVVERDGEDYRVIAGNRRLLAAKAGGQKHVPCLIREVSEVQALEIALAENLQRLDMRPLEVADAISELRGLLGTTQTELAKRIGKSQTFVSDAVAIAALPEDKRDIIATSGLPWAVCRELIRMKEWPATVSLAQPLSSRDVERARRACAGEPRRHCPTCTCPGSEGAA